LVEAVKLPPLGATMDDCCRIAEMLLGAPPSGDTALTIAILTIVSQFELSVSVVYTASPAVLEVPVVDGRAGRGSADAG
jgi:hypothetical protein